MELSMSLHDFARELAAAIPEGDMTSENRVDNAVMGFNNYMEQTILLLLDGILDAATNYERYMTVIAAYANVLTKDEFIQFIDRFNELLGEN